MTTTPHPIPDAVLFGIASPPRRCRAVNSRRRHDSPRCLAAGV